MKPAQPLLALTIVIAFGCQKSEPEHAAAAPAEHGEAGAGGETKPAEHAEHAADGAHKYAVPFAWETGQAEPLSLARHFMHDAVSDNGVWMRAHDGSFFKPFADAQHPRATIVTCSDSRVQSDAWDLTPENDDFVIRNIGNQFGNAQGSVEYGVHHLKTPVLLVLGHTGCGAVKAAMGDYGKESEPIRHELDGLKVSKLKEGQKDSGPDFNKVWSDAVVANVHDQVTRAVARFGEEVLEGSLIVVGAVYDFRNDRKQGWGKLAIVDVNGNADPQKVQAFEKAVAMTSTETREPAAGSAKEKGKDGREGAEGATSTLAAKAP